MIQHKVLRVKKETKIPIGINWPAGFEFEIVRDVIYVQGNMLPPQYQTLMLVWVNNNPTLFEDDTRH
jgi:hypothetical protein